MNYRSFLFNFSASYSGGGLKRFVCYSQWFNENGGASFIVNYRLKGIENAFPANKFYFLKQSVFTRVINSSKQLDEIIVNTGPVDFYYSYGIPLQGKIGRINWFHLSNVLPLKNRNYGIPLKRRFEFQILGFLIRYSLRHADIISAESLSSLELFKKKIQPKLKLSVNGSDDEIDEFQRRLISGSATEPNNIAVTVGTYYYKCIGDVYKIYLHLRESNPTLALIIVGEKDFIPQSILKDPLVIARGLLPHAEVRELLKHARYYLTSTIIENSSNATSEGVFLASESFLSDIGPHRELLKGMNFQKIDNIGTLLPILSVKSIDLNDRNLKSWHEVIIEMLNIIQKH